MDVLLPRVVIVGASLAGGRTARELREAGFAGAITVIGEEAHLPYDRPPLSKQVLSGKWTVDQVDLHTAQEWQDWGVELILGTRAVSVGQQHVELADGRSVGFDELIIATGASARRLPGQPEDPRIHVIRTRNDAARLRARLVEAQTLVVVGGGFIGAEVAAVARGMGVEVTLVEVAPAPFARVLGDDVARLCARLHTEHGVVILAGRQTVGFHTDLPQVVVVLDDGTELVADDVLVGVGSAACVDWLSGSAVPVVDGAIPCGPTGTVEGLDHVSALGDVAAWFDPRYGDGRRIEHWTSATDQARIVARRLMGLATEPLPPPYFWSDQYTSKIQLVGRPDLSDRVETFTVPKRPGAAVATYYSGDHVIAAVTFSAPHVLARLRPLLLSGADRAHVEETLRALDAHRTDPQTLIEKEPV